jgi:hypothetical protein
VRVNNIKSFQFPSQGNYHFGGKKNVAGTKQIVKIGHFEAVYYLLSGFWLEIVSLVVSISCKNFDVMPSLCQLR